MTKKSVFGLLKKIDGLEDSTEPTDNIGDRIMREFYYEKDRSLRPSEQTNAISYFAQDYKRAHHFSQRYFNHAKAINDPDNTGYWECLKRAWRFSRRAAIDVKRAIKIHPERGDIEEDLSYEEALDKIKDVRKKLYLLTEFPECYNELIPLYDQMEEHTEAEEFETAAKFRDRIDDIILEHSPVRLEDLAFSEE